MATDGSERWMGRKGIEPGGEKSFCAATSPPIGKSLCITLGELLAQQAGCPQRSAFRVACPRWRDSGNPLPRTGFGATQVPARTGKLALVHTRTPALLLRLCIYKDIKKKTENNFPGPTPSKPSSNKAVRGRNKTAGRLRSGSGEMGRAPCTSGARQRPYGGGLRRKASRTSTERGRLKR